MQKLLVILSVLMSISAVGTEYKRVACEGENGAKYEIRFEVFKNVNELMYLDKTYAAGLNINFYKTAKTNQHAFIDHLTVATFLEENIMDMKKYFRGDFFRKVEKNIYTDSVIVMNPNYHFMDVSYVWDNETNGRGFQFLRIEGKEGIYSSLNMNLVADSVVELKKCIWSLEGNL